MTISLPADLAELLGQEARRRQSSDSALARQLIAAGLKRTTERLTSKRSRPSRATTSPDVPKTLADLFAGRVGSVHSGGKERLSEDCGEKFTAYLESKRQADRM